MSELILTEEEKAAISALDLDDADLGRFVKHNVLKMKSIMFDPENALKTVTMFLVFTQFAEESNAAFLEFETVGCTYKEKQLGNWTLTLKKNEDAGDDGEWVF